MRKSFSGYYENGEQLFESIYLFFLFLSFFAFCFKLCMIYTERCNFFSFFECVFHSPRAHLLILCALVFVYHLVFRALLFLGGRRDEHVCACRRYAVPFVRIRLWQRQAFAPSSDVYYSQIFPFANGSNGTGTLSAHVCAQRRNCAHKKKTFSLSLWISLNSNLSARSN